MALIDTIPDPAPGDAAGVTPIVETDRERNARMRLALMLLLMGTLHFVAPRPFDKIIPRWLPGRPRAWTYASGVWELASGTLLAMPRTRRIGAWASLATLVAVYPANVQQAIENPPTTLWGVGQWVRLPLQLPMWLAAYRHTK